MLSQGELAAMHRALELARRGGSHPNPCVGAVILDDAGRIIGEGVTDPWPGTSHAERNAISALGDRRGATLVVTLEPCDHTGRSGPCTEQVLAAGIGRVVVAALDPDPRARGRGVERLRAAGVDVEADMMRHEVEAIDPAYFHHRTTGRPLVTLKSAMTLDGQTAARDSSSQWITSPAAREDAHGLRAVADAVMVGAGTLRADDPQLNVRLAEHSGRQPTPIIVSGRKPLPAVARLWERDDPLIVSVEPIAGRNLVVPPGPDGLVDPVGMMDRLGEMGFVSVLVEGGPTLAGALWRAGMVDRGVTYLGARIAGGSGLPAFTGEWATFSDSREASIVSVDRVGSDLRVIWAPSSPDRRVPPAPPR